MVADSTFPSFSATVSGNRGNRAETIGNRGLSISGNRAETVGNRGNGNKIKGFSGKRKRIFTISDRKLKDGFPIYDFRNSTISARFPKRPEIVDCSIKSAS